MSKLWAVKYSMDDGATWFLCNPLLVFNTEEEAIERAALRQRSYPNTIYRAAEFAEAVRDDG